MTQELYTGFGCGPGVLYHSKSTNRHGSNSLPPTNVSSSSLCEGLPPPTVPWYKEDDRCKTLRSILSPELAYRVRIHNILVEATHLVAKGLDPESNKPDNVLTTTIDTMDNRLKENYHETGNDHRKSVTLDADALHLETDLC